MESDFYDRTDAILNCGHPDWRFNCIAIFDLRCQQEIDCFISGLPFPMSLRTGYGVLVYCNTFFWGVKPGDADLFAILDIAYPTMQ